MRIDSPNDYDSQYIKRTIEVDWVYSSNGNYVCIYDEEIVATVYQSKFSEIWQIVMNKDGKGHFVKDEFFEKPSEAKVRTEAILSGTKCN